MTNVVAFFSAGPPTGPQLAGHAEPRYTDQHHRAQPSFPVRPSARIVIKADQLTSCLRSATQRCRI